MSADAAPAHLAAETSVPAVSTAASSSAATLSSEGSTSSGPVVPKAVSIATSSTTAKSSSGPAVFPKDKPPDPKEVLFPHNLKSSKSLQKALADILERLEASVWTGDFVKWYAEEVSRDHALTKKFLQLQKKGKAFGGMRWSDVLNRRVVGKDADFGNFNVAFLTRLTLFSKKELLKWRDVLERTMYEKHKV